MLWCSPLAQVCLGVGGVELYCLGRVLHRIHPLLQLDVAVGPCLIHVSGPVLVQLGSRLQGLFVGGKERKNLGEIDDLQCSWVDRAVRPLLALE